MVPSHRQEVPGSRNRSLTVLMLCSVGPEQHEPCCNWEVLGAPLGLPVWPGEPAAWFMSTGKQVGLAKQRDNCIPSPSRLAVTALLPASKCQEKLLCPRPSAATAGNGSQRQLHGTAFETPPRASSHFAAAPSAPSPCSWLHSRLAGSRPLLPTLQWVPLAGSVMVNIKRKPGISSTLIMLENQSGLLFFSTYPYLHG